MTRWRVAVEVWLVAMVGGVGWAEDAATSPPVPPRVVGAAEAELVARLAEADGKLSSQLLTNDTGGPQEGDGAGLCALLGEVGELSAAVEQERVRAAKRPRYYANRAAYDAGARYARERAVAAAADLEARGKSAAALAVYRACYDTYPECPGSREIALKMATLARSAEDWPAAVSCLLDVLSTGADRCFVTYARLAENQRYLDEVAKPPAREMLTQALAELNALVGPAKLGETLSEGVLASFGERWWAALQATYLPTSGAWLDGWSALAREAPAHPWGDLCRLAMGEGLLREARYSEAEETLAAVSADEAAPRQMARRAALLQAQALTGLWRFREAQPALNAACGGHLADGQCDEATSPQTLDRARELLAWLLEQGGYFGPAAQCYQRLAEESRSLWQRQQCEQAQKRVAELARAPVATTASVVALPDDRTTRGYWPMGYGTESYVLCAQQFVVDRTGGAGPQLVCRFATTDAKEPSRLWVSTKRDWDPAAMWDPVGRSYRSANRDDCGEQRKPGEGPDLLVTVQIPDGTHVLSLYFVNDHTYYEPNREYTISMADAQGKLQAVAEVRDFGGGVYKRFAVTGPQSLQLRIWRNLGMNVLLSGLFLDAVRPPATPPELAGVPEAGPATTPAWDEFARVSAELESGSARCLRPDGALWGLTDELRRASQPGAPAASRPAALWMLSECYHLLGQHRRAEGVFDQYLTGLGAVLRGPQLAAAYDQLAGALVAANGPRSLTALNAQRRTCREGQHRWDRIWNAYLGSLWSAYAGNPAAREKALVGLLGDARPQVTGYARRRAFALLQRDFPKRAAQADALLLAADAAHDEGDTQSAAELTGKALACGLPEFDRARALFSLLECQTQMGVPLPQIQATYQQLAPMAGDRRYARLAQVGMLTLARASLGAQQTDEAEKLLRDYEGAYGADPMCSRLKEACQTAQVH